MVPPRNIKYLEVCLGMLNYVSKLLPTISDKTKCMRNLEKKTHTGAGVRRNSKNLKM